MPDQRTEGWRRTSLRGLSLDAVDPLGGDTPSIVPDDTLAHQAGASCSPIATAWRRAKTRSIAAGSWTCRTRCSEPLLAQRIEKHFGTDRVARVRQVHRAALRVLQRGRGGVRPARHGDRPSRSGSATTSTRPARPRWSTRWSLPRTSRKSASSRTIRAARVWPAAWSSRSLGANAHVRYVHLQRWQPDVLELFLAARAPRRGMRRCAR